MDVVILESMLTQCFCSLRENQIGDEGACAIAEALKVNSTVQFIE